MMTVTFTFALHLRPATVDHSRDLSAQNDQSATRLDARLVDVLVAAAPARPSPWPALGDQLAAAFAAARAVWPSLPVNEEAFARHLGERLTPPFETALDRLEVEDLYLACACLTRVPRALELFDQHVLPRIEPVVRRYDPSPAFADEVRQALREKLFLPPPRIAEFSGEGSLVSWLRAAAGRTALNALRPEQRHTRAEPDELDALPLHAPDPELMLLKGRHRAAFRSAFQAALAQLPVRERTALKLNALEGMTLDKIGAMYGKDKSTVSRWLSHAQDQLLELTRAQLKEQLKLGSTEVESLIGVLQSQLASSLVALIGE